jgi:hypothetical protein
MIAFQVAAGTPAIAIRTREEWMGANLRRITTRQDHLFVLEDVIVDPLGRVGTGPQNRATIGGAYAQAGYYGFETHEGCTHPDTQIGRAGCRTGWILLTQHAHTE